MWAGWIDVIFMRLVDALMAFPPLIVLITLDMGVAILSEAALSFLGIGVKPPVAAWGSMLQQSYEYLITHPHLSIMPGICIMLVVLGFNLMGDAIRGRPGPQAAGSDLSMSGRLLEIKDLKVQFSTDYGLIKAVDGVSMHIDQGEIIGLVGESGCGKSVSQMSYLGLIPSPPGKVTCGIPLKSFRAGRSMAIISSTLSCKSLSGS